VGKNVIVIVLIIVAAAAAYCAWSRSRTPELTSRQLLRKYSEVLSAEEVKTHFGLKVAPVAKTERHLGRGMRMDWSVPDSEGHPVTFLTVTIDARTDETMPYLLRQRAEFEPRMLEGLGRSAHAYEEKAGDAVSARTVTLAKERLIVELRLCAVKRVLGLSEVVGQHGERHFSLEGLIGLARKLRPRI
jgi:hypothetical protein